MATEAKRRWVWIAVGIVVLGVGGAFSFKPLLFYFFRTTHPLFFESDLITRTDPRFTMDLLPNLHQARLVVPARPHNAQKVQDYQNRSEITRRAIFYVDTNTYAFRSPEIPVPRVPGSFRMACLGDSITFGWGVAEEDSYPGQLRRLLPDVVPARPLDVLNAGIPGLPIENIAPLLTHKVAPFKPDIIYAMKYGNLQNTTPEASYRRELHNIVQAARALGARIMLGVPPVSSFDLKPESRRFGEILHEVGLELGVPTLNFVPIFEEAGRGRGLKLIQMELEQQLVRVEGEKQRVLVSASVPASARAVAAEIYEYLDKTDESEALFFDDGHPDGEGNLLIARTIIERMKTEGWNKN